MQMAAEAGAAAKPGRRRLIRNKTGRTQGSPLRKTWPGWCAALA